MSNITKIKSAVTRPIINIIKISSDFVLNFSRYTANNQTSCDWLSHNLLPMWS